MGADYYKCYSCDCTLYGNLGEYDECDECETMICWTCSSDLGIRKALPEYPGDPVNDPFKIKREVYDQECYDESDGDDGFEDILLNCPFCEDKAEESQKDAVLNYLLKKNGLTLKEALKEINGG